LVGAVDDVFRMQSFVNEHRRWIGERWLGATMRFFLDHGRRTDSLESWGHETLPSIQPLSIGARLPFKNWEASQLPNTTTHLSLHTTNNYTLYASLVPLADVNNSQVTRSVDNATRRRQPFLQGDLKRVSAKKHMPTTKWWPCWPFKTNEPFNRNFLKSSSRRNGIDDGYRNSLMGHQKFLTVRRSSETFTRKRKRMVLTTVCHLSYIRFCHLADHN
jgi:hypothetical protein